jgi:hypothetical protein
METTFVNSMDSAALAVVVPVVARGLRERSAELKKMAAMTAGNIFALVNEPRDMAPFVPVILPEVVKAMEHSHPDVRRRPLPLQLHCCPARRSADCSLRAGSPSRGAREGEAAGRS